MAIRKHYMEILNPKDWPRRVRSASRWLGY